VVVSITRADDGAPVTGLTEDNFRIAWHAGDVADAALSGNFQELAWEPGDKEPAGFYQLTLQHEQPPNPGARVVYCVGVRVVGPDGGIADQGQGVIGVIYRTAQT
jgi:hypothetical protein